jgi:hypothetical protein
MGCRKIWFASRPGPTSIDQTDSPRYILDMVVVSHHRFYSVEVSLSLVAHLASRQTRKDSRPTRVRFTVGPLKAIFLLLALFAFWYFLFSRISITHDRNLVDGRTCWILLLEFSRSCISWVDWSIVRIRSSSQSCVDVSIKEYLFLNSSFRLSFTRNIRLLCYAPFPPTKHGGTSLNTYSYAIMLTPDPARVLIHNNRFQSHPTKPEPRRA